jgi:hypothetical protein
LKAFYASPAWLFSKAVYFMFQRTKLGEYHIALKVRVITVDGLLFNRVSSGDYKAIRLMLTRHEVSPDELYKERHQTALHVRV